MPLMEGVTLFKRRVIDIDFSRLIRDSLRFGDLLFGSHSHKGFQTERLPQFSDLGLVLGCTTC